MHALKWLVHSTQRIGGWMANPTAYGGAAAAAAAGKAKGSGVGKYMSKDAFKN